MEKLKNINWTHILKTFNRESGIDKFILGVIVTNMFNAMFALSFGWAIAFLFLFGIFGYLVYKKNKDEFDKAVIV